MNAIESFHCHYRAGLLLKERRPTDDPVSLTLLKGCLADAGIAPPSSHALADIVDFLNGWLAKDLTLTQKNYYLLGSSLRSVNDTGVRDALHLAKILRRKSEEAFDPPRRMAIPEAACLANLLFGVGGLSVPRTSTLLTEAEGIQTEEDLIRLLNQIHPQWRDLTGYSRLFEALFHRSLTPLSTGAARQ